MLDVYGALVLAGGCALLIILIHGQQARRPSPPILNGRERVTPIPPIHAHRAGTDLGYAELERMSRESGLRTYRIEDMDLPRDSLDLGALEQKEMPLDPPDENLPLILHVAFSEPCPAEALHDYFGRAGLLLAKDGLYRKTRERDSGSDPMYYVASHRPTGSFVWQGELIDSLSRITLFTQLPLPANGLHVFSGMLRVAEEIRDRFGGALLDNEDRLLVADLAEAMVRKVEAFESDRANPGSARAH